MTSEYYYMELYIKNELGELDNQKFFEGPLPEVGESVEMVFVNSDEEGRMRFQLKTKK